MSNKDFVLKTYEYIKFKPIKSILITVLVINILVLLIQLPFWLGKQGGIPVDYNVGDLLVFHGSMIAAFATLVLGMVSYVQNHNLSGINSRLMNMQNQSLLPVVEVSQINVVRSSLGERKSYKPFEPHFSRQKTMGSKFEDLKVVIPLCENFYSLEETSINITVKSITPNLIKKLEIDEIRTNVVENSDSTVERSFISSTGGFTHLCSTSRIINNNDEVLIKINLLRDADGRTDKFEDLYEIVNVRLKIESLMSLCYETIKVSFMNSQIIDTEYFFDTDHAVD